jgi:hypothetical protein
MKIDSIQLTTYISIAVIVISLFFIGTELTGYAGLDTGIVNVTIETSASIVFLSGLDILDLGNGTINATRGIVDSSGGNENWTGTQRTGNLTLQNDGNINVSVTLYSNKSANVFLGGGAPVFQLLVTQNEPGSCASITNFSSYASVTVSEQLACTNLGYNNSFDEISIDARINIDNSVSGAKTVGVIATATAVP